jgi:hypothetical protein
MPSMHAVTAPRSLPPDPARLPPEPGEIPLKTIGPIDEAEHVLLLGGPGPELMCALLHAGASNVTHLRGHERPEAGSASLVIVPKVPSLDWLATTLGSIRRALTADGRVVLFAGTPSITQTAIRRMLLLHGMTEIRADTRQGGLVFTARPRTHRIA